MTPSRALLAIACFVSLRATGAQRPATHTQHAADSVLDARTSAVASGLRCPVCQGLSIQESPSELSQQMRDIVKDQLRAGKSPDEVNEYFVSRYGEWILLEPKARGFNVVVYALPVLLVLGGIGVIAVVVRRWTAVAVADG